MEVPQTTEHSTDGLEEYLSRRAFSMITGLCPTASTTENREIIIKTQMSQDPVFLLSIYKVRSVCQKDSYAPCSQYQRV